MAHAERAENQVAKIVQQVKPIDAFLALHAEFTYQPHNYQFFTELIEAINVPAVLQRTPPWLQIEAYLYECTRLNAPGVWNAFLEKANPTDVRTLARLWGYHPSQLGLVISNSNRLFFGLGIPMIGMAAVFGPEIDAVVDPEFHMSSSADAVFAAGHDFPSRVSSLAELDSRMIRLFPESDSVKQPQSAFSYFLRHSAFQLRKNEDEQSYSRIPTGTNREGEELIMHMLQSNSNIPVTQKNIRTCPNIKSVRTLLEAFGKMFHADYQKIFNNRVFVKPRRG